MNHLKKIFKTPDVCIMKPDYLNDKVLTENHVKSIMKDIKASLQEWENMLKERKHTIPEKKK